MRRCEATRCSRDLPGEADRSRQEAVQRVHRLARLDEGVEELWARDLVVAEASARDEVLSPQVLDQRMIRVVAGRRPLERVAFDRDAASDDLLPRVRLVDDPIADLSQTRLLHGLLVPFLVLGEPLFVVVLRQVAEEREEPRGEVFRSRGHPWGPPLPQYRISPVEHWRERPGIDDRASRGDLLAADTIPFAKA